jgi:hypothetical protein
MTGLKARFETFIKTFDHFESIEELLKCADLHGKKRADYLLCGRTIIIEQKVLEVDPIDKPQKFINKLVEQGRILFFGKLSTAVIFRNMPDRDRLQRSMILKIAKVIDDCVAKADKQTRDTRKIFSIPDAVGILIILNEKATILNPEIIHYSLSQVFQKKSDNGSLRYPHNNGVILISDAHHMITPQGKFRTYMTFTSPHRIAADTVLQFSDRLLRAWAEFNGIPVVLPK